MQSLPSAYTESVGACMLCQPSFFAQRHLPPSCLLTIGMPHRRVELELRGKEGVLLRERRATGRKMERQQLIKVLACRALTAGAPTYRRKDELSPQKSAFVEGICRSNDHDLPVVQVALVLEAGAEAFDGVCEW